MMTDKQTPADWVLIEAAKRSGVTIYTMFSFRQGYAGTPASFRALCDMIEKYEQPPVDRKVLCARKAITQSHDIAFGSNIQQWQWIAIRAIELWIEGYGE